MSMPSAALGGSAATMQRIGMFAGSRVTKSCPNCKDKSVVIYDNKAGDELCSRCGLILESRVMSDEQEWRSFSNTDGGSGGADRSRVGGPNDAWLQDGVQGTTMLGGDRKHTRLLQTHEMATGLGSSDRQLKTSFSNLRLVTESFALRENVVERCKEIVKDLQSSGTILSSPVIPVVANCVPVFSCAFCREPKDSYRYFVHVICCLHCVP
eukprot:Lankesteria_metandrocarpae@DN2264_c0_g1_i1.p1